MLDTCHRYGQAPIVTFSHFSVPRWFAERGGWEVADAPALFARYCGQVTARLGAMMAMATTFNEANVQLLVQMMGVPAARLASNRAMMDAARRATGSPRFSTMAYADPAVVQPIMLDAHARGYAAIKAIRPALPVGVSLTTQEIDAGGDAALAARMTGRLYGGWLDAARSHADFVGVQTYTRFRFDSAGLLPPPPGAKLTDAGYENRPEALAATIRWAHAAIGKPIYVTENGIATDDDRERIAFIDAALAGVRACIADSIPVHSYLYWSLLDNFEWASGYAKHFGLVAVDRATFARTPKPSARYLGQRARSGVI